MGSRGCDCPFRHAHIQTYSYRRTAAFCFWKGICLLCGLDIVFHLAVNIGMVIGLCPVIGIPLPFSAMGGLRCGDLLSCCSFCCG